MCKCMDGGEGSRSVAWSSFASIAMTYFFNSEMGIHSIFNCLQFVTCVS